MHSMLNYGSETADFDRQARTLAYTVLDGNLRYYSAHAAPPSGDRTADYHVRQLGAVYMTGSACQYVQGLTVLRNGREFADGQRSAVIRAANAKHNQIVHDGHNDRTTASVPHIRSRQEQFTERRRSVRASHRISHDMVASACQDGEIRVGSAAEDDDDEGQ